MQRRFYAFWAINAALDEARLRGQLDRMRAFGFDGVVFHPRFYPNKPPYLGDEYLRVLSRTILHAKSIDLDFWLYDEDSWPSGTVGGQLLRRHPQDVQQWADLVTDAPADCLGQFEQAGRTWYVARRRGQGVDYLNPNLAEHFLAMTHERYRTGLSPEAWAHVSTIFTDEPEFGLGHAYAALSPHGAIPWTPALPALYEPRYGRPLAEALPLIFLGGDGADVARIQFWELLTDRFNDACTRPIDAWCRRHGKRYTGHVKGEEHPLFQVPMVGSCTSFYRAIGMPGIDALERVPSNDFYPRQAASAAAQFGDGRCMAECFGGAGWGASPADLERYLLWLGRLGVTDFVLHLWQYRLDSHAIRDWPASVPNHLGWQRVFPQVLADVRAALAATNAESDTLVVTPHRGIMATFAPNELQRINIHDAATYALSEAGRINAAFMDLVDRFDVPPHYTDERTVDAAVVRDGRLIVGHQSYVRVCVATGCRLADDTRRRLAGLLAPWPPHRPAAAAVEVPDAFATATPAWVIAAMQENDFPLDAVPDGRGGWSARINCADAMALGIVFADDVVDVFIDGQRCPTEPNGEGTTARLVGALAAGAHRVGFGSRSKPATPSLWAHGTFRVMPDLPFEDGPNGTLMTRGGFTLHASKTDTPVDAGLAAAGYGFCRSAVDIMAIVPGGGRLRPAATGAAAAEAFVDGNPAGIFYRSGEWLDLPAAATCHVRLRLYPSTFNTFGPHHYFAGDRRVISPEQFAGRRNFADPPDAPAQTTVAATFVRDVKAPASFGI